MLRLRRHGTNHHPAGKPGQKPYLRHLHRRADLATLPRRAGSLSRRAGRRTTADLHHLQQLATPGGSEKPHPQAAPPQQAGRSRLRGRHPHPYDTQGATPDLGVQDGRNRRPPRIIRTQRPFLRRPAPRVRTLGARLAQPAVLLLQPRRALAPTHPLRHLHRAHQTRGRRHRPLRANQPLPA